MKQGRTIIQLAQELERQRQARKDFVAETRKLVVKTEQGQSLLWTTVNNLDTKMKTFIYFQQNK